jgi:hypothetical protein
VISGQDASRNQTEDPTLAVIAIFFFAQKYFIQGVTLTGMKG